MVMYLPPPVHTIVRETELSSPLTVGDLKRYLRIDHDAEDHDLQGLLDYACEEVEKMSCRPVTQATYLVKMESWGASTTRFLRLPRLPVISIAQVQYFYGDALVTLAPSAYAACDTGLIRLVAEWPQIDSRPDAIQVRFNAGTPASPHMIQAIYLLARFYYAGGSPNLGAARENDLERARALLSTLREAYL